MTGHEEGFRELGRYADCCPDRDRKHRAASPSRRQRILRDACKYPQHGL